MDHEEDLGDDCFSDDGGDHLFKDIEPLKETEIPEF